jgi:hypothetical protein
LKPSLKLLIPRNRFGDYVVALASFLRRQHRFPASPGLMNDVLFRIKTGRDLLDPLCVFTTDKEYVKLFVKAVVGDQFNIETIGVIKTKDDVDTFDFPKRCCIKPTHASGKFFIRKDGEPLPLSTFKSWLDLNYYDSSREKNYKSLQPKIIIEPLVFDCDNPDDHKFFCYNGKVKFAHVDFDRTVNHTRNFYDREWKRLNFSINYPSSDQSAEKPACLPQMIEVCEKLASDFPFVRIDFYTNGTEFLVGEITHCAMAASGKFMPRDSEKAATELLFSD